MTSRFPSPKNSGIGEMRLMFAFDEEVSLPDGTVWLRFGVTKPASDYPYAPKIFDGRAIDSSFSVATETVTPSYLAADSTHFYVAEFNSSTSIWKYTHAGSLVSTFTASATIGGMVHDGTDLLYIGQTTDALYKMNTSTGTSTLQKDLTADGVTNPRGLFWNSSLNRLYVSDEAAGVIYVFDNSWTLLYSFTATTTLYGGFISDDNSTIWGLIDSTKHFHAWGTVPNLNRIGAYDLGWEFDIRTNTGVADTPDPIVTPRGVAKLPDGRMAVADLTADKVFILSERVGSVQPAVNTVLSEPDTGMQYYVRVA